METIYKKIGTNARVIKDLLTKYPNTFKAFKELINNSIQANAHNIEITIDYVDTLEYKSGIKSITIRDDGPGVPYSEFDDTILEIGTTKKEKGQGIGRFSAFQIGNLMHIKTVSFDKLERKFSKTVFSLHTSNLEDTKLGDESWKVEYMYFDEEDIKTYYEVKIEELHHNSQNTCPKKNAIVEDFTEQIMPQSVFENYLHEVFNDIVAFTINGNKLSKEKFIIKEPFVQHIDYTSSRGSKVILDFYFYNLKSNLNKVKVFYRIDNSGIKTVAHEFTFSSDWYTPDLGTWFIYVDSSFFDRDLFSNMNFETLGEQEATNLKQVVRDTINDFFKARNKRFDKFLSKLENDKYYPYKNISPTSDTHEVIFKKIAYILEDEHKLIAKDDKIRDFIYSIVDKSISNGNIEYIFKKILNLSDDNLARFRALLSKTEIENVVRFSSTVARKLDFLNFLHELIYGDISMYIKERSQLHKIVERELWLFGENYNGVPNLWSDRKIGNILTELRETIFINDPTDGEIQKSMEGLNDITDLFFYNNKILDNGDREIMIVELKSPKTSISEKELNQIDRYAFTIEDNPIFPSSKVKYKLILISSKLTKYAQSKLKSRNDQYKDIPFLYEKKKGKNIEIYVMEWSELIELNKRKLGYLSEQLNVKDSSVKEIFETEYPELIDEKVNSQLRLIK